MSDFKVEDSIDVADLVYHLLLDEWGNRPLETLLGLVVGILYEYETTPRASEAKIRMLMSEEEGVGEEDEIENGLMEVD